jgi:hypothetical protein
MNNEPEPRDIKKELEPDTKDKWLAAGARAAVIEAARQPTD